MIIKVIRCIGFRRVKRTEIYWIAAAFRNDLELNMWAQAISVSPGRNWPALIVLAWSPITARSSGKPLYQGIQFVSGYV